jgi:coat protein Gp5
MANTLYTIDEVTLEALSLFKKNLVAAKRCSRKLEDGFGKKGAQRGDSVRIRKPANFTVRSGDNWQGQNIEEQFDALSLNYKKGVDFSMNSNERKLDLNSLSKQVLAPAIVRLANEIDKDILQEVAQNCPNAVGAPGTVPNALSTYINVNRRLGERLCPRGKGQRNLIYNSEMEATLVPQLVTYQNPTSNIADQYKTAEMGPFVAGLSGWDVDENLYVHTVGTYGGTPLVNAAVTANGAETLVTDGWTSGGTSLKKGDRFTVASVYAVDPITKARKNFLQQFQVTSDISDTTGSITATITPPIRYSGVHQNVDSMPADNAAITMFGATGTVTPQAVAFNEEAVALAIVPLEEPGGVNQASMKYDDESGLGMRYIEWYDGDVDLWKSRFDVVYGIKVQRSEWACALAS